MIGCPLLLAVYVNEARGYFGGLKRDCYTKPSVEVTRITTPFKLIASVYQVLFR